MIGRISGILLEKQAPELLVDIGGIGYEVQASLATIYQLPALGEAVTLHTHFVVREDAQLLYGFVTLEERSLFRSLIKVNGVGPKLAITILSGIDTQEFVRCVRDGDTAALVKLPGVGKKTAERLLVEMKDRLSDWQLDSSLSPVDRAAGGSNSSIIAEAESALVALGYKPQQASSAIAAVNNATIDDSITNSEELIRRALKNMVA